MTFGQFVRNRRQSLGISLRNLAVELQMTPSYLSDIENNKRAAPSPRGEHLDAMMDELQITDTNEWYDLVGASRGFVYEEICDYLRDHEEVRKALRAAASNADGDEMTASGDEGSGGGEIIF
jgi:transcriptional regulator with XRE-family HTH domain